MSSTGPFLIVSLGIMFFFMFAMRGPSTNNTEQRQQSARTAWLQKEGEDVVSKRKQLLDKIIQQGIFQKLEIAGDFPHLWVKPPFYALDYETKQDFVRVAFTYCYAQNEKYNMLFLFDSKSGKKIGNYSIYEETLRLE